MQFIMKPCVETQVPTLFRKYGRTDNHKIGYAQSHLIYKRGWLSQTLKPQEVSKLSLDVPSTSLRNTLDTSNSW